MINIFVYFIISFILGLFWSGIVLLIGFPRGFAAIFGIFAFLFSFFTICICTTPQEA